MTDKLIIIHALLGGIALLVGFIALASKKGSSFHKKTGILFYYSMLASALIALIISVLPQHESPFLFTIGIFSSYLVYTGRRAICFKKEFASFIDKIITMIMLITGLGMILYPIIMNGVINIILSVFGTLGIILSITDLRVYSQPEKLKKGWLRMHIGKITGGYIAAITAFVVVNNTLLHPLIAWLGPGIIGSIYIIYWTRKVTPKK